MDIGQFTFKNIKFTMTREWIEFQERRYSFSKADAVALMYNLKLQGFENNDIRSLAIKTKYERSCLG